MGFVSSLIPGGYLAYYFNARLGFFAFVLSFSVVCWALIWVRRKTRNWAISADAKAWLAYLSWRQLHPCLAKYLRTVMRYLLWLPSLSAAFVLFFFPVASHVLYGRARLVSYYQTKIPLNWFILKSPDNYVFMAFFSNGGLSRHGFTPIWFNRRMPSAVEFFTSDPDHAFGWYRPEHERATGHFTHLAVKQFQLGRITMTCFEYRHNYENVASYSSLFSPPVLWESLCSTQSNGIDYNLRASFFGYREDLSSFYEVLNSAKPAN